MKTSKVKTHKRKGKVVKSHSRKTKDGKGGKIKHSMATYKMKLKALKDKYGDDHPKVKQLIAEMKKMKDHPIQENVKNRTKEMRMKHKNSRNKRGRGMRKKLTEGENEDILIKNTKNRKGKVKKGNMKGQDTNSRDKYNDKHGATSKSKDSKKRKRYGKVTRDSKTGRFVKS